MNRLCVSLVVAGAFVGAAWAQTAPAGANASTLQLMNMELPDISFEGQPFDQVMDWVASVTGLNVQVRWQTLENAGVERDKPISIRVKKMPVRTILWMVINEAGGPDLKLAYRASGNLLIVSTADELGKEMLIRVYDVADLLVQVPNFTDAPKIGLGSGQGQQGGGGIGGQGGGGGQSIFSGGQQGGGQQNTRDEEGEDSGEEDMTRLIELITATVEPDTWQVNGGLGSVMAFGRQIVVRNNILVHQAIDGYLSTETD